jgi:predicted aspartyl protease
MGKVTVQMKLRNWDDSALEAAGRTENPVRTAEAEGLVDTGATGLYLKPSVIQKLGLRQIGERKARTMSDRLQTRRSFSPVELEIQGRTALLAVSELAEGLPNVIGQIPLEMMDWVVDLRGQRLVGNPEHGGEMIDEEF